MTIDSSMIQFKDRGNKDSSVYPISIQKAIVDKPDGDDLTTYITQYNISLHQVNKTAVTGSPRRDTSIFTLSEAIAQVPDEYKHGGLKLTFNSDMLRVSGVRSYVLDSSVWTGNAKSWYEEGNNSMVGYYTCTTSGGTASKAVNDASGYVLSLGGSMKIRFTNKHTGNSTPTLNINGQGAKTIVYDGSICSSTNTWADDETVEAYFDGSVYQLNNVAGGGTFKTGQKVKNVGIDNEPTTGSNNLVKSGGVYERINKLESILNINSVFNHALPYTSKSAARNEVTLQSGLRKKGLIITYLFNSGAEGEVDRWITEQYFDGDVDYQTWSADVRWKNIAYDDIKELENKINNRGQFINVNKLMSSSSFYSLSTAIAALWNNHQELCTKGTIITFLIASDKWNVYQYNKVDNTVLYSDFSNISNWTLIKKQDVFFVPASSGIAGINNVLWAYPNGCTIELEEGTYSGSAALEFTNGGSSICSNCLIIGKGVNTIISRTTGYNDLIAQAGSNNVVKNCKFAHSILRDAGKVILEQCLVNNNFVDDSIKSCYDIKIAASNSTQQAKLNADIVCSGTNDQTAIQTAINSLSNGGSIFLAAGTYNLSAYVNLSGKSNISLKGSGYKTYLYRSGGYAIWDMDSTPSTNCCLSELRCSAINLSENVYQYNLWIGSRYVDYSPNKITPIVVKASAGIVGINTVIGNLVNTGGKIILEEGTYTGTDGINFRGNNIIVEGQGAKTIINRTNGSNDVYADSGSGNILRQVKLTHSFQQGGDYPTARYRIEDCIINGKLVNQVESAKMIINIGANYFFKSIGTPYSRIFATGWKYNNRFEFHIYGHILETSPLWLDKPVDFVGHNALVEINGDRSNYITFDTVSSAYTSDMKGSYPTVVKDIHFIKTGCFNYRDASGVSVVSKNTIFRNCIFENASSSPSPFDNSTQSVGAEDANGCRRHGIVISIPAWGNDCKTEFHDCIGIGSPYGFQSTRGWYFKFGSPKLFNCIARGGGIGEFGHGVVSHESSNAQLFNCVAYAGEHTYRQGAGFRYQAHGSNNMVGCVGYGSHGTQLKSMGISEEKVLEYCSLLGITDTTFLYTGGAFNYSNMTIKNPDDGYNASRILLGNNIKNSDITLVELGGVSEEGYGISMWAHNGEPTLINCKGYAGHGINSKGIHIISDSHPTIIGGFYGNEKEVFQKELIKDDSGYCQFRISKSQLSEYTPYIITSVGINISGASYLSRHLVLHIETVEETPREVITPYDLYNVSSIGRPLSTKISIPAGVQLKSYITENGSVVTDYANSYYTILITFMANQPSSSALYVAENAEPIVKDAILSSTGKAINTTINNIKVFDCLCYGDVSDDITFASKTAINGSSNYYIS